jgi:hypothetical protein
MCPPRRLPDGTRQSRELFLLVNFSKRSRAESCGHDRSPANIVRRNSVNPESLSSNEGGIRADGITMDDTGRLGGHQVWANAAVRSEPVHDSGDHTQLAVTIIGGLVASTIYRIVIGIRTVGIGVSVHQADIRRRAVMHVGDFGIEKRSL